MLKLIHIRFYPIVNCYTSDIQLRFSTSFKVKALPSKSFFNATSDSSTDMLLYQLFECYTHSHTIPSNHQMLHNDTQLRFSTSFKVKVVPSKSFFNTTSDSSTDMLLYQLSKLAYFPV